MLGLMSYRHRVGRREASNYLCTGDGLGDPAHVEGAPGKKLDQDSYVVFDPSQIKAGI
jgi:hypothetical protein